MSYHSRDGTIRKMQEGLYDDEIIDDLIEATGSDVVAWINAVCGRTTDFSDEELLTTENHIIVLCADCYCACRILSEQLESHGIENESLARYRCGEARDYITLWCVNHGITPSFDGEVYSPVMVEFGYGVGSDTECI